MVMGHGPDMKDVILCAGEGERARAGDCIEPHRRERLSKCELSAGGNGVGSGADAEHSELGPDENVLLIGWAINSAPVELKVVC